MTNQAKSFARNPILGKCMNVYVDPKPDESLVPILQAMVSRGVIFQAECRLRGARFLPKQVMRPLYAQAGLEAGPMLRPRPNGFFDMIS